MKDETLISCSPKLYFYPICRCQRTLDFRMLRIKAVGFEFFGLLPNHKTVSAASYCEEPGGPDWARTSDPALIKRML